MMRRRWPATTGSSPHARGTHHHHTGVHHTGRFIPACAGNTGLCSNGPMPPPVHPRMRGEHVVVLRAQRCRGGSSPHARGTLFQTQSISQRRGFIPACAGNTVFRQLSHCFLSGSSPHARGTRPQFEGDLSRSRFIPACAGNTRAVEGAHPGVSVHPRMRGEHVQTRLSKRLRAGSSPHARGTRFAFRGVCRRVRFIPACAGNTDVPYI